MTEIQVRAYAKINLYLDVVSKRPDGYHNLETLFHSIQLHDDVIIRTRDTSGVQVHCEHPAVPCDSRNLAHRAAALLTDTVGDLGGVTIEIRKRIPVAAGLAGGSANAAAVLHGMNELFRLGLEKETLMALGTRLGADVPFCLQGGAAFGRGIGDRLTPLPALVDVPLVLLNPGVSLSTASVFQKLNFSLTTGEKSGIIINACLAESDLAGIGKNLYNRLEDVVFSEYPEFGALKAEVSTQPGVFGALMSGSGATVFAVTADRAAARRCESHFKNRVHFCTTTGTSRVGTEIY